MLFAGVYDNGYGRGNALIAAAGGDNHRHVAAVHACFGCSGSVSTHFGNDAVRVGFQNGLPDSQTECTFHAFFGNGHVAGDLLFGKGADLVQFHFFGKGQNVFYSQMAAVGFLLGNHFIVKPVQVFAVFADAHNVGVAVPHFHFHMIIPGIERNDKVQGNGRIQKFYLTALFGYKKSGLPATFVADVFQHFHIAFGIAAKSAQHTGSFNAGHAAGIRNAHTAYVFDNIAAAAGKNAFGLAAQLIRRPGRCQCQSNGFGAAHGRNQFLFENIQKTLFHFRAQHMRTPFNRL